MAVNEKSLKNLKQFSSTYQPKNRGRKPSQLRKFIKDNNIDREDVALMIKNVLFSRSYDQLTEMLQDTKQPMIIRLFIKSFLSDFKRGSLINLNYMLDRAFGTPQQEVNVSGNINIDQLTFEEREAIIDEYLAGKGYMPGGGDASDRPADGVPGGSEETQQEEPGATEE